VKRTAYQPPDVFVPAGKPYSHGIIVEAGRTLYVAGQKLFVGRNHRAQSHERAHDLDVDPDRLKAVQHTRKHGDSLLGECEGCVTATTPT
jgi:hypothetical protein